MPSHAHKFVRCDTFWYSNGKTLAADGVIVLLALPWPQGTSMLLRLTVAMQLTDLHFVGRGTCTDTDKRWMSLTKFQGNQAVPHKIELSAWFRLPFQFLFAAWTYILHLRTRFLLKCQARRKKEQREQKAIGALCADRCIHLFVSYCFM